MCAAGNVSPVDLDLVHVADDAGEVVQIITDAHNHQGIARKNASSDLHRAAPSGQRRSVLGTRRNVP